MSPRRKSGLSPKHLKALEHLGDVLEALEALQTQHAKVRALMGERPPPDPSAHEDLEIARRMAGMPNPPPEGTVGRLRQEVRGQIEAEATKMFEDWRNRQGLPVRPEPDDTATGTIIRAKSATLDTPERREYEEAKRAGRKVPVADPFANASPAQRERMAEQRAIIDAERAARGLPTRGGRGGRDRFDTEVAAKIRAVEEANAAGLIPPDAAAEVVRTEVLDTVSDGTTPLASDADDDPEVH